MKNKLVFLAACAVTVLMPATVKAQYPGITKEAGEISGKIMSEGRQRSDEAWALNWKPITHLKVQMMERINARM